MKISIITVCLNAESTILETMNSVFLQDYNNIEYIIIDGGSTDNTLNIINNNSEKVSLILSEKDNGLYDAINKGITFANGDIIGILNADDTFVNRNIVNTIMKNFINTNIDLVYGDIAFIDKNNNYKRLYSSKLWNPKYLKYGYMPAHPTFYCRKVLYSEYGNYDIEYKIAADFELISRFFKKSNFINYKYIPEIFVYMKLGGLSTRGLKSKLIIINEIMKACKKNRINTNYFYLTFKYVLQYSNYLRQLLNQNKYNS